MSELLLHREKYSKLRISVCCNCNVTFLLIMKKDDHLRKAILDEDYVKCPACAHTTHDTRPVSREEELIFFMPEEDK